MPLQSPLQSALAIALSALALLLLAGLARQTQTGDLFPCRIAFVLVNQQGLFDQLRRRLLAVPDRKHAADFPSTAMQWYAVRTNLRCKPNAGDNV